MYGSDKNTKKAYPKFTKEELCKKIEKDNTEAFNALKYGHISMREYLDRKFEIENRIMISDQMDSWEKSREDFEIGSYETEQWDKEGVVEPLRDFRK